jgi:hypothetical protein
MRLHFGNSAASVCCHLLDAALLQAGLQQLETALEGMDRPAGAAGGSSSGSGSYLPEDLPAERVLSIAIHISEMPSTRQEEALARLPRPVRLKVLALLREQAVLEGEEQMQHSQGQPGSGAGLAAGADAGVIHTREYDLSEADRQQVAAGVRPASGRASPAAGVSGPRAASPAAAAAVVRGVPPPPGPAAVAAAAARAAAEEDLLGMSSPKGAAAGAAPAAAAAAAAAPDRLVSVDNMDDFFSGGAAAAPSSRPAQQQQQRPRSAHTSVGNSSSMSKSHSSSDGQLADLLGGGGPAGAAGAAGRGSAPAKSNSMINLGGLDGLSLDAVDVGRHG